MLTIWSVEPLPPIAICVERILISDRTGRKRLLHFNNTR